MQGFYYCAVVWIAFTVAMVFASDQFVLKVTGESVADYTLRQMDLPKNISNLIQVYFVAFVGFLVLWPFVLVYFLTGSDAMLENIMLDLQSLKDKLDDR